MSEPPIPPPDTPTSGDPGPDEHGCAADAADGLEPGPALLSQRSGLRVRRSRHAAQTWPLPAAHTTVWRVLVIAFFGGVLGGVSVDAVLAVVTL